MRVLVTGGAGFIGSRLVRKLAGEGAEVTVLDSLSEQIHAGAGFPAELTGAASCIKGDIRDRPLLEKLVANQEVIVHLAAETGTGQSMYEVAHYEDVNIRGTALLLDILVKDRPAALKKLIVASSRAVYGEGAYTCRVHGKVFPSAREGAAMRAGRFEPICPVCQGEVEVLATGEDTPFNPSSFYGLTKQVQEQMVLMFAGALGISGIALRYQNVFGPGQSLHNPYTGILAIFSNLVRRGQPINIFEDGEESRDFVFVDDVVDATVACAAPAVQGVHSLNVGSGVRTSVLSVAKAIVRHFRANVPITVTGDFRVGDIRHNFADIGRLAALTGFAPRWTFTDGLTAFLGWAEQHEAEAGFEASLGELRKRGLMSSAGAGDLTSTQTDGR